MAASDKIMPILIIDDNPEIHADFTKVLSPQNSSAAKVKNLEDDIFGETAARVVVNHVLVHAQSGEEAVQLAIKERAAGRRFAMAFVDMRMPPGWDGLKTMEELKKIDHTLSFVVCTAYSDYTADQVCERLEIRNGIMFMSKPFMAADVRSIADSHVRQAAAAA